MTNNLEIIKGLEIKEQLHNKIIDHYHEFEEIHKIKKIKASFANMPVNFKQAKTSPIHRWFTYKEGFSPGFVRDFIQRFSTSNSPTIFDPFGGIGTTVLESSLMGFSAYSNDVNPLSNYISQIKNTLYSDEDIVEIQLVLSLFREAKLVRKATPPENNTVNGYFTEKTLSYILQVKYWINVIEVEKVKHLFNLALLTSLEEISTHRKDGNGVKRKRNYVEITDLSILKNILSEKVTEFLNDIRLFKIKQEGKIYHRSSFDQYSLEKKADLIVTSPPYANCFDYSKVYLIELWFGGFFKQKNDQKEFRENSLISHVHYKWQNRHVKYGHDLVSAEISKYLSLCDLWDRKIPQMLVGYFSDMGKVLHELIPNLNKGAIIGMVVGNSVYAGLPIATDILVSEIAMNMGYELIGIESYRTLSPSSQQLKIIKKSDKIFLRESLIILKWK